MALTPPDPAETFQLPNLPVPHKDFIRYVSKHGDARINDLIVPYKAFENKLREGFALHPHHPTIRNPNVNVVPVFVEDLNSLLRIQARSLDDDVANEEYMMPLKSKHRKATGTPAVVDSFRDFKKNFDLFSESSLIDLDWSNVVAAGSSVVTPLIPVPEKYNATKKALREYYHQKLAPSSDVDLFIWGLDEAAGIEKIKQIETSIRNAILEEVTTVRTKNAITIVSKYPTRHVQIVLRLYKSVSEILTGFDVDCSCFAYDGKQVYGTPRALAAFMTQTNTIDLTRRSPSYESRLSKYAKRGFEIHWPHLNRSKIDPTIFERSFARTTGLARLLVLERLPKSDDREEYLAERRKERGRPQLNKHGQYSHQLAGNLKDSDPNDVAEWVYEDEISNYHSFTIPYGPKYHAKKIEKILYTKDLLLNAEWNTKDGRKFSLHRHPCFIGDVDSVMLDCCGLCPEPTNDEERKIAKEEAKVFVFGQLEFMKDDPGRQAIGSFNPLTNDDWTDMAYIGGTGELCHKICECDLEYVKEWCSREGTQINRRDHTGRTPLHLAIQASSPEVVKCLVDNGARIVARLVDGMTALHIAAARGDWQMVQILLEKSEANEEEEADKQAKRKSAERDCKHDGNTWISDAEGDRQGDSSEDEDIGVVGSDASEDSTTMTEGSFVKVKDKSVQDGEALPEDEGSDDPDIYDVNVTAWDAPVSALHLAILGGHIEVIKTLVSKFGADVLLPVKILNSYSREPEAAIMTLVLAARLSGSEAMNVGQTLLSLGASSAQADMDKVSALHYIVAKQSIAILSACFSTDESAAKRALNHLVIEANYNSTKVDCPLTTAIRTENIDLVNILIDIGAKPTIELDDFVSAYSSAVENKQIWYSKDLSITEKFKQHTMQPVLLAVEHNLPSAVYRLLEKGADVNTMNLEGHQLVAKLKENADSKTSQNASSLLDLVNSKVLHLKNALDKDNNFSEPVELDKDEKYLHGLVPGSYEYWQICKELEIAKGRINEWHNKIAELTTADIASEGRKKKHEALTQLIITFQDLRRHLVKAGALKIEQLHPEIQQLKQASQQRTHASKLFEPKISFQVSHCTQKLHEAYLQLFQAAWDGNADKIRELTLASWGPEGKSTPLQIAVQDNRGFSPFALALFRHHMDVAQLILNITAAQFKSSDEDSQRRRYTMIQEEYSDENSDDEGSELGLTSQLVDEIFTIDDITALPKSVASKVSVSSLLGWCAEVWMFFDEPESVAVRQLGSIFADFQLSARKKESSMEIFQDCLKYRQKPTHSLARYAIALKDVNLLKFLLHSSRQALNSAAKDAARPFPGFYPTDFHFALEQGNLEAIAEMVKTAGAELPLDSLVVKSGVAAIEKPRYYPGLSIGGRKMTQWAQQRRGRNTYDTPSITTPPLLLAAYHGGIAATEWFLSDTPLRLYKEFSSSNSGDSRLKVLAQADGGIDLAIISWLRQRSNLAIHLTVLSRVQKEQSLKVLNYLIQTLPESMETKSESGHTPLSLAFNRRRVDAAKALIAAGADQTTRDFKGRNIIHLALWSMHKSTTNDAARIESLLHLIDKRVRKTLFLERCQQSPGGTTPLAHWLSQNDDYEYSPYKTLSKKRSSAIFETILKHSDGEDLLMMDGSGQFPLHQAVKGRHHNIASLILQHDPALIGQENAMGQTPLELAEALYVRHCTRANPEIVPSARATALQDRHPDTFLDPSDDRRSVADTDRAVLTWQVCKAAGAAHAKQHSGRTRKLVSLHEAREVAKRLTEPAVRDTGEMERRRRRNVAGEEEEDDDGEDGNGREKFTDEVWQWSFVYD